MIRTSAISRHEACLSAIAALDELVMEFVRVCHPQVARVFLDWVADEATPLVERRIVRSFDKPAFYASLHRSDHRLALHGWVRLWVLPLIAVRFHELAAHLPERVTSPAAGQRPLQTGLEAASVPQRPWPNLGISLRA